MFEWDERKRLANIRKHRVDFALVAEIFEGEYVEVEERSQAGGERRFRALGAFEGQTYLVVYTWRGEARRIISAWRVGARGARRYQALLARGIAGDAEPR